MEECISTDSQIYILESCVSIVQFAICFGLCNLSVLVKLELELTLSFAIILKLFLPLIHYIALK